MSKLIASSLQLAFLTSLMTIQAQETPIGPRAARSVHLGYPAPEAELFYLEMVVDESTPGSYFMTCGWNTGYFGIQELSKNRKVAIFSVWDPTTGDRPEAVKTEDRVELLHQGEGVRIRRFGGEGTGGQCMIDFPWNLGETNRFLVAATVQSNKTAYAGYLWQPHARPSSPSDSTEGQRLSSDAPAPSGVWRHLVTFRTRTGGQPLKGLYSFVEDFRRDYQSVHAVRRARYFNGWVRTTSGQWKALTQARFTASGAEWESKENIDAGIGDHQFYLATGGSIKMTRPLRSLIELPVSPALPPPDLPDLRP